VIEINYVLCEEDCRQRLFIKNKSLRDHCYSDTDQFANLVAQGRAEEYARSAQYDPDGDSQKNIGGWHLRR
jgi:hypothetical protein